MPEVMIDIRTEPRRILEPELGDPPVEKPAKAANDEICIAADTINEFSSPDGDTYPARRNPSGDCWHVWPPDVQADSACTLCGLDYQEWVL